MQNNRRKVHGIQNQVKEEEYTQLVCGLNDPMKERGSYSHSRSYTYT